jgi:integrase
MRSVSKAKSSPSSRLGLHDRKGHRLYLTAEERAAFLTAAQHFPREVRTLCVILHDTGCRISEALALTADRVDFSGKAVVFETLKKRTRGVFAPCRPDATLDLWLWCMGYGNGRTATEGEPLCRGAASPHGGGCWK